MKKKGASSKELAMRILEEAQVAVVPGSAFGSEGEGYVRIAYANSYENLESAIEQIAAFMLRV